VAFELVKMRITLTTQSGDIFNMDVSEDLELENFKAFCEVESGIPSSEIVLVFQGKVLQDASASLKSHGLSEGDVVLIQRSSRSGAQPSRAAGRTTQNIDVIQGCNQFSLCLIIMFS